MVAGKKEKEVNRDRDHLQVISQLCGPFPTGYISTSPIGRKLFMEQELLRVPRKTQDEAFCDLLKHAEVEEREKIACFLKRMIQIIPLQRATPYELLEDTFLN